MSDEPNQIPSVASAAGAVISGAWEPVRLQLARRGAQDGIQIEIGSIEPQLDEAIDLLANQHTAEFKPWHAIKSALAKPPDIFDVVAVREWIDELSVRAAFKRIAIAYLSGNLPAPEDERLLVDVYVERTLNDEHHAKDAITQVHSFLALSVTRFLSVGEAAILSQSREQTDAIRADIDRVGSDVTRGFAEVQGRLSEFEDALELPQPLPNHFADRELRAELTRVMRRRYFIDFDFSEDIKDLVERVSSGDMRSATGSLRIEPLRHAARLAASRNEIAAATQLVAQCRQLDPSASLVIEDAWISAANSDVSTALDSLWGRVSPEDRAALLSIIRHYRSSEEARNWLSDEGFNASDLSARGSVLAVNLLLEADEWDRAYAWTQNITDAQRKTAPVLEALCGITATLVALPEGLRRTLLDQNLLPFFDLRSFKFFDDAASRTAMMNARSHFESAAEQARILKAPLSAARYDDIALWLAFQEDASRAEAVSVVEESVQDNTLVFRRLRFALSYGIDFNRSAVQAEIARREKLDATTLDTVSADLILAVHSYQDAPQDLAAFIARKRNLLLRHFDRQALASLEIEALANSGQVGAARSALDEARHFLGVSSTVARLEAVIAEASGEDPVETRRAAYESSGRKLPELYALVEAMRQRESWRDLLPFARELHRRERSIDSALLVYRCCQELRDDETLSDFLLEIGALVEQSLTLKSALAWNHFGHGRLKLARQENDDLLSKRSDGNDRNLAINIAVESGDWSALNVIVERGWDARATLSAEELMSLARCASEIGNIRMLPLAELAVEKAPQDAAIHINAWLLVNESGELANHPKASSWFATAVAHSGEDGPLTSVSMRELEEGAPGRHERYNRITEKVNDSSLPLFIATEELGIPIVQYIAGAARNNAEETDRRHVVPIHAFNGSRGRLPLNSVKSLGLDLSAIVVLGYLGVLEETIQAFDRIILPAGTLTQLFADRQQIRFRQPRLIEEAQLLQSLIADGAILRMEESVQPDPKLTNEVGLELAELVATAQRDGGIVLAPAPVYKVESFMEVLADVSSIAQLLTDTHTILAAPELAQILDTAGRQQAAAYLTHHDKGWTSPAPLMEGRSLYLSWLAADYLSTAQILPHVARLGFPVYISRQADEHSKGLIRGNARLQPLVQLIEDIRRVLADGLDHDRISVGARNMLDQTADEIQRHPTMALDRAATQMDAVAIDDRAINKHPHWTDPNSDQKTPIVCTLDVLDHLRNRNIITQVEYDRCCYRLRRDGFNVVPILPEELLRLVEAAEVKSHLVETAELRAVRESISRLVALRSILLPQERAAIQIQRMAATSAIRSLWTSPVDRNAVKAKAVWLLNLVPDHHSVSVLYANQEDYQLALADRASSLAHLAVPLFEATDTMEEYAQWVDETVFRPLQRSDPEVFGQAFDRMIESLRRSAAKEAAI